MLVNNKIWRSIKFHWVLAVASSLSLSRSLSFSFHLMSCVKSICAFLGNLIFFRTLACIDSERALMQHAFVMCRLNSIRRRKKYNSIDSISVWYTVIDMRIWWLCVYFLVWPCRSFFVYFSFDLCNPFCMASLNYNDTIEWASNYKIVSFLCSFPFANQIGLLLTVFVFN